MWRSSHVDSAVQVISAGVRRPGQRARRAALTSLWHNIKADICNVIVHNCMVLAVVWHTLNISRELYALIKCMHKQWIPGPFLREEREACQFAHLCKRGEKWSCIADQKLATAKHINNCVFSPFHISPSFLLVPTSQAHTHMALQFMSHIRDSPGACNLVSGTTDIFAVFLASLSSFYY